ncbi:unnamed protein product [Knipowitschia caucasica]
MERITSAQPPPSMPKHPSLDMSDMEGIDFPLYVYKSRRGIKRGEENKDTYKLPHRLIEKKRRDRINECIAQLKDLLPEHLKLTTLGHLEKAVVLELTLKHVKAQSILLEQQQQKIINLQKDLQIDHESDSSVDSEEMFRSGFHLCAKEVLHYLANQESRDLSVSHVVSHIHKVAAEVLHHQDKIPAEEAPALQIVEKKAAIASPQPQAKNCVPVIQRTHPYGTGELSGSDTDTDSGYGGEQDKRDQSNERIKQESTEPPAKKSKRTEETAARDGYLNFSPNQPPFCMPFYLIPPTAAAAASAYLPMLDKCWYPGGMSVMYPCVSSLPQETLSSSSLIMSPRSGSPLHHHTSMDSTLHKALKPSAETKD